MEEGKGEEREQEEEEESNHVIHHFVQMVCMKETYRKKVHF